MLVGGVMNITPELWLLIFLVDLIINYRWNDQSTRCWPTTESILLPERPRIFDSRVIPPSGLTEKGGSYPGPWCVTGLSCFDLSLQLASQVFPIPVGSTSVWMDQSWSIPAKATHSLLLASSLPGEQPYEFLRNWSLSFPTYTSKLHSPTFLQQKSKK